MISFYFFQTCPTDIMSQIDKCLREVNLSSTEYPVRAANVNHSCWHLQISLLHIVLLVQVESPFVPSQLAFLLYRTAAAFFPSLTYNFPCNLNWKLQKTLQGEFLTKEHSGLIWQEQSLIQIFSYSLKLESSHNLNHFQWLPKDLLSLSLPLTVHHWILSHPQS